MKQALSACRAGFAAVVVFSFGVNMLMLTGPLYMLQIFDRVVTSRSTETLFYVTLIAGLALLTSAVLEIARTQVMVQLGTWLDQRMSGNVLTGCIAGSVSRRGDPSVQSLRDLSTFRTFLTGPGVFPILDAPWTPIFLAVIFILHPMLGWLSLAGAIILFSFAIANELLTRTPLKRSGLASIQSLQQAESAARNANVIEAMGMMPNLVKRWHAKNSEMLANQAKASTWSGGISAGSRFVRQGLQIGVLGTGAWLVLKGALSPGMMIAASILMSRALAPVEQAIGSWRSAIAARTAYDRVKNQLADTPERGIGIELPTPAGLLTVDSATYFHDGMTNPTLRAVAFRLEPGEAMGLIGPTASGKSTLAELLVGIVAPSAGHVRLDGADVATWEREDLGRHIGYLPQDIELFGGTVRENIARMGDANDNAVIAAAQLAGVHELILRLPAGYETEIGVAGVALSGGQRQRIALARAVFGHPRFVILDEPSASLDAAGEEAMVGAIAKLKESGITVVVIAHRPNILRHVDKVLILLDGVVDQFGPRDEVIPKLTRPQTASVAYSG